MADLVSYGNADRDIEQALTTLKKGSQLLKYGRKGKPKFCQFRLSNDESSLIWISSNGERSLKLTSVSRIIPGQRTPVFRRYLRPEKDYLSFSLIYNEGKRSLDLICKDKAEAESWIAGIRALISSGHGGRSKIDGWSDGSICLEDGRDSRDLTSNSPSSSSVSATQDIITPPNIGVGVTSVTSPSSLLSENPVSFERSHASSDSTTMQVKGSGSDVLRVSVSSAPSTSSHGSQPDDCDALGDVYIWGEVICDSVLKVGPEKNAHFVSNRADVLVPRPLESNVVLDVHHIACGVRHAALVTKQGEVFTWGEESGGRLGHGVGKDVVQPRLVESLGFTNFEYITCGEFHTCAVTVTGELYTWGDGTHNAGLLGNGTDVSHWIPKRISGPLEGLSIAFVSCGPWHTALITSVGQLFTFGDGTFGVLGHGDRENVMSPREVESLSGLRTVAVACGVWHTAAIVEVIVTQSSASTSSGKLFTWGDGDKNRLGHGDKEARLEPTCVPFLIEHNFCKISCGHSITVGLTTSGRVFTMGSTVYGQLGNANADGKLPCLVEDRLASECVEEISCGAYHVAVLTARNEVYTWGKGANGRLGHGDVEDRKTPTLVESLKDRHVKFIACGSNYSAAICLHKWVSGAEQSQCSSCRLAFGFTRKRHNCYNCGLVHCHSCSSKKALRAALAPNPRKPYRVCDSCYTKLNKVLESNLNNRKSVGPRLSGDNRERLDKADLRLTRSLVPSNIDLIKQLDSKAARQGKKADTFSLVRSSQTPSLLQLKDVMMYSAVDMRRSSTPKPYAPSGVSSRSVSPFSRRPSPPRSVTPIPTTAGLSLSKGITDSLKKTNELLNQEVLMLRSQVERLRQRCEQQEMELLRTTKKAQEATATAADESAKSRAAKEVIKSLTAQLRDMAERLPAGNCDAADRLTAALSPKTGIDSNGTHDYPDSSSECHSRSNSITASLSGSSNSFLPNGIQNHNRPPRDINAISYGSDRRASNGGDESSLRLQVSTSNGSEMSEGKEPGLHQQDGENSTRARNSGVGATDSSGNTQVDAEWIEQYEPGVYITLVALRDGTRDLKRVRFSRRRFGEHQAETWWSENREKVYEKYNVRGSDKSSVSGQTSARRSEGAMSPAPSWVGPI